MKNISDRKTVNWTPVRQEISTYVYFGMCVYIYIYVYIVASLICNSIGL